MSFISPFPDFVDPTVLSCSESSVDYNGNDFDFEGLHERDSDEVEYFPIDLERLADDEYESEIVSNFDFDEIKDDKYNSLLHPNLKTTKLEALQMILSYFMRYKLSLVALEDLLLLVNSLFQQECLPTTKPSFFKLFSNQYTAEYHFYCRGKDCGITLVICKDRSIKRTIICDVCSLENIIQSSSENFFVTLPLEQQLKEIIHQNSGDFEYTILKRY